MCDVYENNPNNSPYLINYEDMFNIILQNIHEEFMINIVSFHFLFIPHSSIIFV